MTNKSKKLLLKELSARFCYGLILYCNDENEDYHIGRMTDFNCDLPYTPTVWIMDRDNNLPYEYKPTYDTVKPYLRPMSSMTEEEKKEYDALYTYIECCIDRKFKIDFSLATDWLNSHYLDFRGLIEKGLALEAPEGMYNVKEK